MDCFMRVIEPCRFGCPVNVLGCGAFLARLGEVPSMVFGLL